MLMGISYRRALVWAGLFAIFFPLAMPGDPYRRSRTPISADPERASATQARLADAYGKFPLSFEANQGQTDQRVKFLSRGGDYALFLTSNEVVLALQKGGSGRKSSPTVPTPAGKHISSETTGVLRMSLIGASRAVRVSGVDRLPGSANYFLGNDPAKWRTNVPTYAKVKYEGVYPGINLIYYGNQRQLEYDFVVAPGADPKTIRLCFRAANKLRIDKQGMLVLEIQKGEVQFQRPAIYQEIAGKRRAIAGRYALKGSEVGFEVKSYDRASPLVIDPVLVYSTYLGGTSADAANGIAVDSSGNAYVTGSTGAGFPTIGAVQSNFAGHGAGVNAFVTKFNASGTALVYSTYLGGSVGDTGYSIAVDSAGNAYVTGSTASPDFPTVNAVQPTLAGSLNAFIAEISASGSALVYSTYLGGSGTDSGSGIAVDSSRNAYVTGSTTSTNFPTVHPLFSSGGPGGAFVTKIGAQGNALVYSTYLGGAGAAEGKGIAVDASGDAFVTGYTESSNFPTMNPLQSSLAGSANAFVTEINPGGSALVYSTYLGGGGTDIGNGIALDSSGNIYVAGSTTSVNFPTVNPLQPSLAGSTNAFVGKIRSGGAALIYSTYLGGSGFGGDSGAGIAVDSSGNAFVIGTTSSTNFPVLNALQSTFLTPATPGSTAAFITKINASGSSFVYSTYFGNSTNGTGIAVDSSGDAYTTGNIISQGTGGGAIPLVNALPNMGSGFADSIAFVAKILSAVNLSPRTLTFVNQPLGMESPSQTVLLRNDGNSALVISSLAMSGATGSSFSETDNCVGNLSAAGASCSISVAFTPTAIGSQSANLAIATNLPSSPLLVPLTGTGVAVARNAVLSVNSLTFTSEVIGATTPAQSVTLSNNGNETLLISSLAASGTNGTNAAEFAETNNCDGSVAAGANCTINVTFSPSATGLRTGALTITDNATTPASPQTVTLAGTGATPPGFSLTAGSSGASTAVTAGQTATYGLSLADAGFAGTVAISCSGAPANATCSASPGSTNFTGASSAVAVTVNVSTTARGGAAPLGLRVPGMPASVEALALAVFLPLCLWMVRAGLAGRRPGHVALAVLFLLLGLLTACGGGSSSTSVTSNGTPAGTYTLTVTGTSNSLTQNIQLTLMVN
jgi:hypothetical protein